MLLRHVLRKSGLPRGFPVKSLSYGRFFSSTESLETFHDSEGNTPWFNLNRVCLLRKITRYEFEHQIHPVESETTLEELLTEKGSDYQGLLDRHDEYQRNLDAIYELMVKKGLHVNVVNRQEYTKEDIEKADAIFTAGGDGTFLLAATKVKGRGKPVIGINTDPVRSEGKLCLPREQSINFEKSLDRIMNGKFRWMWRNRIRISMTGQYVEDALVDLHELMYPESPQWDNVRLYQAPTSSVLDASRTPAVVLPVWALNEVYIGEALAARVSFYEVSVDDSPPMKQKSSGITVCTGTGSTSWFFNINHVPTCSVKHILEIVKSYSSTPIQTENKFCSKVADEFNNSLTFNASDAKMAFVVRDPVPHGIFQVAVPRGFCTKMWIRSRMFDGWVAVDGGPSFHFNDGAVVELEMLEEDALRCITLD